MKLFFRIKRRLFWKLFSFLPKSRDKVVLQSYYGRGYSDSPKAIANELLKRGGYRLYWVVNSEAAAKTLPDGITPIFIDTLSSIRHLCTAGFWIDNCRKYSFTQKGKGQYYIQSWHGFPLKRIEKDAGDALPPDYILSAKKDSAMCNLFLSDSSFLTDIYHSAFWYDGEVLESGLPRNDILVNGDEAAVKKVYEAYRLDRHTKIILYAPTFRKGMGLEVYDLDYEAVKKAAESKFGGKWVILAKLHPNIAAKAAELGLEKQGVINASDYSDIQELYLVSGCMVTDYSSVMFDFMMTNKPCFLYVNDLQSYRDDRNFYFDMALLPFSLAEDNAQLRENIRDFDTQEQLRRVSEFCEKFGINESGQSAERAVDKMDEMRG